MRKIAYLLPILLLTSCGMFDNSGTNPQTPDGAAPLIGNWGTTCSTNTRTAYNFGINGLLRVSTLKYIIKGCLGAPMSSVDTASYHYVVNGADVTLDTGTTNSALTFQWVIEGDVLTLYSLGQKALVFTRLP